MLSAVMHPRCRPSRHVCSIALSKLESSPQKSSEGEGNGICMIHCAAASAAKALCYHMPTWPDQACPPTHVMRGLQNPTGTIQPCPRAYKHASAVAASPSPSPSPVGAAPVHAAAHGGVDVPAHQARAVIGLEVLQPPHAVSSSMSSSMRSSGAGGREARCTRAHALTHSRTHRQRPACAMQAGSWLVLRWLIWQGPVRAPEKLWVGQWRACSGACMRQQVASYCK